MVATLYFLSALATILAWIVARRRSDHRSIAILLTFGIASDLVQRAILHLVLPPPLLDNPPLTEWTRVAGHAESALFIAWPFGIAAQALWVFSRRRPRIVALAYIITVVALIMGYPATRGRALQRIYLGAELSCLFVALAALFPWLARLSRLQDRVTLTSSCTGLLVTGHFAAVVSGPYRVGLFGAWSIAQASYLAIYSAINLMHGVWLWEQRRQPSA